MENVLIAARQFDNVLAFSEVTVADDAVRLQSCICGHLVLLHHLVFDKCPSIWSFGAAGDAAEDDAQQRDESDEQEYQYVLDSDHAL